MNIKALLSKIKQETMSARGRSALTFLIFLLISTIFWFMMTLNETIQRDYRLPIEITGVPEGTTFITQPPQYIDVSVKDKGRGLIKYDWGTPPTVKIRYKDFIRKGDSRIVINQEMLSNNIRNAFGARCEMLSIRPDSINLLTTSRPGDKLPIFLDISTATEPQYIVYGKMQSNHDSVMIYSLNGIPASMLNISTEHLSLRNLTDTTIVEVPLKCPTGSRVEPSKIKITIPVEPLVAKKRTISIQVVNKPKNTTVHTFPANIELNYLIPMSMFKNDTASPTAVIDYRSIDINSTTVGVKLTQIPDYYYNTVVTPTEVEYIIEK